MIFTSECAMKIVAYGFVSHQNAYLKFVTLPHMKPKVCHLTSYETNNISPALKEFLNDVDFRNTWNILDFTIVMIGLVFNLLLSPQQSEYSIKLAPIQFLKNYENLFFLSLFSSLLAVLQIQVNQPSTHLLKPKNFVRASLSSYSGPQCDSFAQT